MENENPSTKEENPKSLETKGSRLREKFIKNFFKKQMKKEYNIHIQSAKNMILLVTLILLVQAVYAEFEIRNLEKMTEAEIVSFFYETAPGYRHQLISAYVNGTPALIYPTEAIVNAMKKTTLFLRKLNYISFGIVFFLFCLYTFFSRRNPLLASIIALILYVIENLLWAFFMGLEILSDGILIKIAIISFLFFSIKAGYTYRKLLNE